jgi:hypothetical protein
VLARASGDRTAPDIAAAVTVGDKVVVLPRLLTAAIMAGERGEVVSPVVVGGVLVSVGVGEVGVVLAVSVPLSELPLQPISSASNIGAIMTCANRFVICIWLSSELRTFDVGSVVIIPTKI